MRFYSALFSLALLILAGVALTGLLIFDHYSHNLPDYSYLKDYQPPTLTRIYADDGRMMDTIAAEERIFVPIGAIPKRVRDAFLSAEDRDFYQHGGVDFAGIVRAALADVVNLARGRRPEGASTITQQVAKNMLLGNEVSMSRKIREAILATRLEKTLSKDRILEIYLNEIYLGNHSYGVAAAALNYFDKPLDQLSVAEAAYLAALPKAPNNYSLAHGDYKAALARRNWVIRRMRQDGHITPDEAEEAIATPLVMQAREQTDVASADYYSEEVRRELVARFGENAVLTGGLAVKTSLDPHLQNLATKALRDGLITYDRRASGFRGPVAHFSDLTDWQKRLAATVPPPGGADWPLAIVTGFKHDDAVIAFADNTRGRIPWEELTWARHQLSADTYGPPVHKPSDVLKVGDVIMVEAAKADDKDKPYPADTYTLRQIPEVEGAVVVLDPNTGRVLALTGGFSAKISQFDRAVQAWRQPGSSFKPFVYMAALDKGFTPSSLILDAPFQYDQGPGLPLWEPENYEDTFLGPTPLRVGIEKSRNVMTARLANAIGMPIIIQYAKKFGIADDMPNLLSFSLGAKETTPLRLTAAYGMIVNGGKRIVPSLIDRVEDRDGKTIWRTDQRLCTGCETGPWMPGMAPPDIPDTREQIEDPRTTYQMVSILEGVVQRGTARRLKDIGVPLAGKTGTTNESKDTWFIGFTPDLVCGVYVGYDDPRTLGKHETGASVAVPVFRQFIEGAIKDKPAVPFRVPPGLRMVRVDPATGALASIGEKDAIWESFIPGTEPKEGEARPVLDGSVTGAAANGAAGAMSPGVVPPTVNPVANPTEPENANPLAADMNTAQPPEPAFPAAPASPAGAPPAGQTPPAAAPSTIGTGGLY